MFHFENVLYIYYSFLIAGTTLIACAMTGRNAVVVDRHEPSCRAMMYRMWRIGELPGPADELNEKMAAPENSDEEEEAESAAE
jgi:DNA modification methylase